MVSAFVVVNMCADLGILSYSCYIFADSSWFSDSSCNPEPMALKDPLLVPSRFILWLLLREKFERPPAPDLALVFRFCW